MKFALKAAIAAILLLSLGTGGWWAWKTYGEGIFQIVIESKAQPEPDAERYATLVADLERWRGDLRKAHAKARTAEEKAAVEKDARVILELMMPEMMRCWLGTPYDFNGTAEKPGGGKVACGYFVSTVIRDAGFRVDRYKLAQQPSENILRTFMKSDGCLLKVGQDFESYAEWVEGMEPGVYLMGLDSHVGFIVNGAEGTRFYHSSGWQKRGVVNEAGNKAGALRHSNWRMIGGLTADPEVIRTWLGGETVKVRS
ncbi:MAG: hypothetical protein B9S30_06715 [Verrucomicrobiia bacterium Tous-C5FEB]|nr:MAG: hypothetical protein B9S30_06715 [Verrucomicrobiae bacterium Tous-C5FEB]